MLHPQLLIASSALGLATLLADGATAAEAKAGTVSAAASASEGARERAMAPCSEAVRPIVVGYEAGIVPIQAGSGTRAVRSLERAFPAPCFELIGKAFQREDLGPSLVKGVIDVGVVAIAAPESYPEQGAATLGAAETDGVDTLLLHPASFSVVASKPEGEPQAGAAATSPWLLLPAGALLGVAALLACVWLLNVRLPRLDRLLERATTRLDPRLTGLWRALQWVYGTWSGRLFALAWAALGMTLSFQALSARALTDERAPEPSDYRLGAKLAAYPGRDVYEFRNQRWKRCPRPFQCLRNYDRGKALALAGDRDVLCRHARETNAAALDFRPEIAIPILYALLLPASGTRPASSEAADPKQALLTALNQEPYTGSPWRACTASLITAEASR